MSRILINGRSVLDDVGLIIFDKDGTLIDVHHYWVSMIRLRAQKAIDHWLGSLSNKEDIFLALIDSMGVDLQINRLKPEGPVGIKPRRFIIEVVLDALRRYFILKTSEEIEAIFCEVDHETASNLKPLLKLLPGVKNFLENCHQTGVSLAIATTDITLRAQVAMNVLGLEHYFAHIVGSDLVKRAKPYPDLGDFILKKSGISAKKAAVIGDHRVDIEMGINCGIGCNLGVLTGLATRADFERLDCHVAASFDDLGLG